ncbi:DUF2911 domain-containing protein [Aquimarina agarivorans]|uniref:DUF2911 domain-containing protein n=1 Tax=Aquimarina agarivorans TaxID=980584 RepID=UPI000248FCC8|nr:DUF2911 domain-containing protein [Aquimarina agarivorans]
MKKTLWIIAIGLIFFQGNAQKFAKLDKSPMDRAYYPANAAIRNFEKTDEKKKAAEPKIRVTYSRPSKKGRTIFGELLKFKEPWRIGANESTEVIFMTDVVFGGTTIEAGRYSLIAIPEQNQWTLHINTLLDGWGNYGYDPSLNIASITATTQKSKTIIEYLSMALYKAAENTVHLKIGWDDTFAEFPITIK